MNRRGFLGRLTGAAAIGAASITPTPTESKRAVEPFPKPFTPLKRVFTESPYRQYQECAGNECLSTDCDLSAAGVAASLDKLEWTPIVGPIAILCVHPSNYALALKIAKSYGTELSVHSERFTENADTWFVAWNGRRYGSVGG